MPFAPMSGSLFLDAINTLLRHIQQDSTDLTNLDEITAPPNTASADTREAYKVLLNTSVTVQSEPHWWNTFTKTLTPDVNNKIALPASTLSVVTPGLSVKDGFLYNDFTDSDQFTGQQTFDVVSALMFKELAEPVRRYITYRAALTFQEQRLGSGEYNAFVRDDLNRATGAFVVYCVNRGNYNAVTKNPDYLDRIRRFEYGRCRPILDNWS